MLYDFLLKQYVAGFVLIKQKGQALPEYATIIALTTVFCIAALIFLGNGITKFLTGLSAFLGQTNTGANAGGG